MAEETIGELYDRIVAEGSVTIAVKGELWEISVPTLPLAGSPAPDGSQEADRG